MLFIYKSQIWQCSAYNNIFTNLNNYPAISVHIGTDSCDSISFHFLSLFISFLGVLSIHLLHLLKQWDNDDVGSCQESPGLGYSSPNQKPPWNMQSSDKHSKQMCLTFIMNHSLQHTKRPDKDHDDSQATSSYVSNPLGSHKLLSKSVVEFGLFVYLK